MQAHVAEQQLSSGVHLVAYISLTQQTRPAANTAATHPDCRKSLCSKPSKLFGLKCYEKIKIYEHVHLYM